MEHPFPHPDIRNGQLQYPNYNNRPIHWANVTTNTMAPMLSTRNGSQRTGHHRFNNPLIPNHNAMIITKTASENPPGFAAQDRGKLHRTNHAQLVVIPQEGQGTPHMTIAPHGGKPNARCVPSPDSCGVRRRVTPRSPNSPTAAKTIIQRSKRPNSPRCGRNHSDVLIEEANDAVT